MKAINHTYETLIFDIFGVLFGFNKTLNSFLKMGALSLHFELGKSKNVFRPIDKTISLLKECHKKSDSQGNRIYKLYVLSNMKTKTADVITKKFPEVFSLFDGIVTSGSTGYKKPDSRIFQYILSTYDLNPTTCIFLDDKKKNVTAAEKLGIQGVICNNFEQIKKSLKKLNVL